MLVGLPQRCGSALVSMRIRIEHFRSVRIQFRIQGFDEQGCITSLLKKFIFFIKNLNMYIYP
jgi:hypothetical protein